MDQALILGTAFKSRSKEHYWFGGFSFFFFPPFLFPPFPFLLLRMSFTEVQGHLQRFLGSSISCLVPVANLTVIYGKYFPFKEKGLELLLCID